MPRKIREAIPVVGLVTTSLPDGQKILLESEAGDLIAADIWRGGLFGFEGPTFRVFLKLLSSARMVLDIGANTGIYSLVAAKAQPACKVHAFEPVPAVLERLNNNIKINGLTNVTTAAMALSDSVGEMTLYVPPFAGLPTSASLNKDFRKACREIRVPVSTLDAYVTDHNLGKVDVIKIDTETTEHIVLGGGKEMLRRDHPAIICEVLEEGKTAPLLQKLMDELGYCYYRIHNSGLLLQTNLEGDDQERNYLFLGKDDPRRQLFESRI